MNNRVLALLAGWRRLAFLTLTAICLLSGTICFNHGKAPDVDVASIKTPPELNIEVSDPNATVNLEVDVDPHPQLPADLGDQTLNGVPVVELNARVSLTVVPPTPGEDVHWLLETLADSTWPSITGYTSATDTYHESLDVGSTSTDPAGYVGSFVAGTVVESSRGVFAANLPPIGVLDYLLATDTKVTSQLQRRAAPPPSVPSPEQKLVFSPDVETDVNPNVDGTIPQKIPGGIVRNYYIPKHMNTTEALSVDASGSRIEEASPSDVELAEDIKWAGGAGLAPNILTSNPREDDHRETLTFFAGALLATAAAAFIAFLQERRTETARVGASPVTPLLVQDASSTNNKRDDRRKVSSENSFHFDEQDDR